MTDQGRIDIDEANFVLVVDANDRHRVCGVCTCSDQEHYSAVQNG